LAGPLDQSPLAFKELVYGRLIRVFAGKNCGEAVISRLSPVFHRRSGVLRRWKAAALILISRAAGSRLRLALVKIGAQLRRQPLRAVRLALPLSFLSRFHAGHFASAARKFKAPNAALRNQRPYGKSRAFIRLAAVAQW
jgi:hypothetical protein